MKQEKYDFSSRTAHFLVFVDWAHQPPDFPALGFRCLFSLATSILTRRIFGYNGTERIAIKSALKF
jgi:hypothetical protein